MATKKSETDTAESTDQPAVVDTVQPPDQPVTPDVPTDQPAVVEPAWTTTTNKDTGVVTARLK